MKRLIFYFLLLISFQFTIYSQSKDFKFGKIDISELTNMTCPIDSNAEAYVIADIGRMYYQYNDNSGFQLVFERKVRIKFIKNTSFEFATFRIPLYNWGTSENTSSLKGFTYNLENGEVVKTKLTKESQFEEKITKWRKDIKVTFPNLKEGSVIDFQYSIYSDYIFNVRNWNFQKYIPTLYSEYTFEKPEYFVFKQFSTGFVPLKVENEQSTGTIGFNNGNSYNTISYQIFVTKFSGSNIPAFREEKYISSPENYLSGVDLELQSIMMPRQPIKNYTKDWKSITEELLDDEDFGNQISKGGFIEDTALSLKGQLTDKKAIAQKIYSHIQARMKWDGGTRIFCNNSIKDAYKNSTGNVAEINLLLVAMLRKAGLNAYPVISSTRDNGMVLMLYPILSKFNYVVAGVEIDGKVTLLDATDPYINFGMTPYRCLNGQGYIIDKTVGRDINFSPQGNYNVITLNQLKLNSNGEFTGNIQKTYKAYAAAAKRNTVKSFKNNDEYLKKFQDEHQGLSVDSFEIKDLDSLAKPCLITYKNVTISNKADLTDSIISFNPMLYEQTDENPFKSKERKYPVDYGYGYDDNYIVQIEMPEGYKVDELPKPYSMSLPDNAGKFTYNISEANGKIQLARRFIISKTIFIENEYSQLKEFYKQMIEKEAQMIVLRKK